MGRVRSNNCIIDANNCILFSQMFDNVTVKITCSFLYKNNLNNGVVSFTATNIGKSPITIKNCYIKLTGFFVSTKNMFSPYNFNFPIFIQIGQAISINFIDEQSLKSQLKSIGYSNSTLRAVFVDTTGKEFLSKPFKV